MHFGANDPWPKWARQPVYYTARGQDCPFLVGPGCRTGPLAALYSAQVPLGKRDLPDKPNPGRYNTARAPFPGCGRLTSA